MIALWITGALGWSWIIWLHALWSKFGSLIPNRTGLDYTGSGLESNRPASLFKQLFTHIFFGQENCDTLPLLSLLRVLKVGAESSGYIGSSHNSAVWNSSKTALDYGHSKQESKHMAALFSNFIFHFSSSAKRTTRGSNLDLKSQASLFRIFSFTFSTQSREQQWSMTALDYGDSRLEVHHTATPFQLLFPTQSREQPQWGWPLRGWKYIIQQLSSNTSLD